MTPEQFVKVRSLIEKAISTLEDAINLAWGSGSDYAPPENRRKATEADIVPGAIIWHERESEDGGWYWHEVRSVERPDGPFKAYTADDGCRYGMEGAWVRAD